jgi:plasmid stability protein
MEYMAMLTVDIPEDMKAQIREICGRRGCTLEEAVRDVLRRWIAVEQFRKDADEVRRFAEAAGFRSEEDILESAS